MNKLKTILLAVLVLAAAVDVSASAQVIQGQVSPGTYVPVAVDSSGVVQVSGSSGSASGSPVSGNPTRVGFQARNVNYTAVTNGSTADGISTLVGAQITKPYSIPDVDWYYASGAGGITNTTDVAIIGGTSSVRNYTTGCSISNASATVATEVVIKDGATIMWRGYFPVNAPTQTITFPTPLRGGVSTPTNVAAVTTGAQVYANCQGYKAP